MAADGLHSAIRRACALDPPRARHPRFGLRRHFRMAPWSDLVGVAVLGGAQGDFPSRLAAFPGLRERLAGARLASEVRGAGPLRQDVRHRAAGNVLLVGDASASGRAADYERAWRRVSRKSWALTSGLLWARHQALLAPRIVPAAQRLPRLFTAIVNHVGQA